jgi:CXXX repeat radical SAM target protein
MKKLESKSQNEEIQSRREFFKNAAKKALPILTAVALASSIPNVVNASCDGCKHTCSNTCSGTCSGSCKWDCQTTCKGTCSGSCKTTCQTTCVGTCSGSAKRY